MKVLLRLVAFIIVSCYFNLCSAATYSIPDTKMTIDIPDTYRVITRQDTDNLVEILNDIYNVKNKMNVDSQTILAESEDLQKEFKRENLKILSINTENFFRFVVTYKPIEESYQTNLFVDFKIFNSYNTLKSFCMTLLESKDYEVQNIAKDFVGKRLYLSFDAIDQKVDDQYLKMYVMLKKNFSLGITGVTNKKNIGEDNLELRKIIRSITFDELDVFSDKILGNSRWLYVDKTANGGVFIDFDTAKIDRQNRTVDIWIALQYGKNTFVSLCKFYLNDNQYATLSTTQYDNKTGKVITSFDSNYIEKRHIVPGTVMEMLNNCILMYSLFNTEYN